MGVLLLLLSITRTVKAGRSRASSCRFIREVIAVSAYESTTHTAMEVPVDLVPAVRELIARRQAD